MGDCSSTIDSQLNGGAYDYTEIRIVADVPSTVNSFSYNLAFFSYEYPEYYGSQYNDMYIGWLESEVWTGNISFDAEGAPISLNAGFLDYRDANAANDPECNGGCSAPELHGTCMEGHAGTKWLTTSAGVQPGETVTIVFAIFDMSDSILDSYAFIDNFQWGCEGDVPPETVPIG
nr:choice-of-anchor L domain-containing protein [Pseudenhygromyxa sp. WMMC2535]